MGRPEWEDPLLGRELGVVSNKEFGFLDKMRGILGEINGIKGRLEGNYGFWRDYKI